MKALVAAFPRGEAHVHPIAAMGSIFTHEYSVDFGHQIPAAAVAAITFGHVLTALLVYGVRLCGYLPEEIQLCAHHPCSGG